ncbi:hypothetical protein AYO21_01126 [Fonsecaea monophora]|uniref:Uncharacterized protein n=1 Tax=Fonsecaea monophora TaxID=254056 RepID=A0A177FLR3_9EURO|nr:hypothetical protein AYO21_01126 [Fonsecaea monophora]OAG44636.1 hypothetical protein AYO21_01126 [Fonsecaea monophora]
MVGFEQSKLGHVHGASHDALLIVRTSYDKPDYLNLAKAAYKDWADVENAAGFRLLQTTGGSTFLQKNGLTPSQITVLRVRGSLYPRPLPTISQPESQPLVA